MSLVRWSAAAVLALVLAAPAAAQAQAADASAQQCLTESGQPAELKAACDRALRAAPNNPGLLMMRARAKWATNDRQGALDDLNFALTLAPDAPGLLADRAEARRAMGDEAGSAADFDRAVAVAPKSADLLFRRATANPGKAAAVADFNRGVALEPNNEDIPAVLARVKRGFIPQGTYDPQYVKGEVARCRDLKFNPDFYADYVESGGVAAADAKFFSIESQNRKACLDGATYLARIARRDLDKTAAVLTTACTEAEKATRLCRELDADVRSGLATLNQIAPLVEAELKQADARAREHLNAVKAAYARR